MKSCLFIFILLIIIVAFLGTAGAIYFMSYDAKAQTPEEAPVEATTP